MLRQKIIFFGNFLTKSYWVLSWVLLVGWPTGQAIAQVLTLRQAVQTALHNYGTIRAKADTLSAYPNRYRVGRVAGTRELVVRPNYIVVYRVAGEQVEILRVRHARKRDLS